MRIERVEIDGFGRFHDRSWQLRPGLSVFLGANEAGKTTFLNAVRALLFGFESSREGRAWYPAFAGGKRGGRLVLATDAGERWVVERHGERGGTGALAVRAPSGNIGGQETLDRLLRGADRDLFANVFAFGLGELQDLRTLSTAAVKGRIYGAGAGLGGASAVDIERSLRDELRATFVPSGSKPPLNALLARAEALRTRIAELSTERDEHAAAHREREELLARAETLRSEARDAHERAARLGSLRRAGPLAAQLDLVDAELREGDASLDRLPDDVVASLDRREAAVERAQTVLATIDEQLEAARTARAALHVEPRLLAAADEILAVREERSLRAATVTARRELDATVARHTAELDGLRARVGGWEADRLLALDDSIAALDATRTAEAGLGEARAALATAEARVRAAADDLAARERELAPAAADDGLERRAAALRELEATMHGPARRGPASATLVRLTAGAVIGLAALAVGIVAGQALVGLAAAVLLGGLAAVLAGLVVPSVARPPSIGDRDRLLADAGLPPDADARQIAERRDELATERARAELARGQAAAIEARREELRRREVEAEAARSRADGVTAEWRTWLVGRGLPDDLSPDGARQVLGVASAARRAMAEIDRARERLAQLDREDEAYAERVCRLLTSLDIPSRADTSQDAAIAGLADALDRARADERRARELDASVVALEAKRAPAQAALDEARAALDRYVADLGCSDAETLRSRAAAAEARRTLHARRRELRAQLAGIAGGPEAVAVLVAESRATDPAAIEAEERAATDVAERLEAEERDAFARIGALEARIRELEAAEELGARRQELAAVEGQAAALARSWAVRALTLRLLEETRARYERERQPDVVRAAETHFERITGGGYSRIVAPPGEDAVRVEAEGGGARGTHELSRGTAEQLYLALRFGLIEEFARHAEPLPVVMDDILVNFDPERAERAAAAVGDLASRHQVLFFTCHPSTARLLDPRAERTITLE